MKKVLLLLLFTVASYGQAEFEKIAITQNVEDNASIWVNVQDANGVINKVLKSSIKSPIATATTTGTVKITTAEVDPVVYTTTILDGKLLAKADLEYNKTISVGVGGAYLDLESLFNNEPAGKTLIKLTDKNYSATNPKFLVKKGWILQGEGYGKTKITFNFTTTIDPALSGLQLREDCVLRDFELITVNNVDSGGFSQYALHNDYVGAFNILIERCSFKTVLSSQSADLNNFNGLSVGIGTWEGQILEFKNCFLEGAYVTYSDKYTLNLHNTFISGLHTKPSRVSFYNSTITGGFTSMLISDTYSNDSDLNQNRVQDLFEFVGCNISSLWIRTATQGGTVNKKNGILYNFSGSKVDEFVEVGDAVDTSLPNYGLKSIPATSDVGFLKNLGNTTINKGDFVSYVYSDRLPEYHLAINQHITTPIGVEKLTALNNKTFAGISLVSSLAGNFLHFNKSATSYTSGIYDNFQLGNNVTFDDSGSLIHANGTGIGIVRKITFDNRLGIELLGGKVTNDIGDFDKWRGVQVLKGKAGINGAATLRLLDGNGEDNTGWQISVGSNSATAIYQGAGAELNRFSINNLSSSYEVFGIDKDNNARLSASLEISTTLYKHRLLTFAEPGSKSSDYGMLMRMNPATGVFSFNRVSVSAEDLGSIWSASRVSGNMFVNKNTDDGSGSKLQVNGTVSVQPAVNGNQAVTKDQMNTAIAAGGSLPYKVYTALLNQSGTSAPVATVLENTLGGTVVWTRSGAGGYLGTLSGAFTLNKSVVFITRTSNLGALSGFFPSNSDVNITTYTSGGRCSDIGLTSASLEIRVYN